MRVYWPEFIARMGVLLGQTATKERARWDLPRTSTEADLLLAARVKSANGTVGPACRAGQSARSQRGMAAIAARTHVTYEALAQACGLAGLAATWLPPGRPYAVQGASLALWDSSGWGAFEAEELARFTGQVAPAPVLALVDFPRRQEGEQILACGRSFTRPGGMSSAPGTMRRKRWRCCGWG